MKTKKRPSGPACTNMGVRKGDASLIRRLAKKSGLKKVDIIGIMAFCVKQKCSGCGGRIGKRGCLVCGSPTCDSCARCVYCSGDFKTNK